MSNLQKMQPESSASGRLHHGVRGQRITSDGANYNQSAINDVPSNKELTGMLSLRDERRRISSSIKAADTIRAKISSTKNAIFHLAIDDPKCGVINTVCSNCGGRIVPLGRDRVKCPECGLVDDRLLAEDLLKPSRSQASP